VGTGRGDQDWRDRTRGREEGRFSSRDSSGRERGFFDRAGDEISSWFGDDDAERRREMDERASRTARGDYDRGRDAPRGDYGREGGARYEYRSSEGRVPSEAERGARYRDAGDHRPYGARLPERGGMAGSGRPSDMDREQHYRPMTGDYGRARSDYHGQPVETGMGPGAVAGGVAAAHDRHYSEWRQRQIEEIDRDYDDYRREHQSKFESDFSNWRSQRQAKRQMLGTIKEHMQVVGSDELPVGTVDKVRGDRIILTKADSPDGQHHTLNCALIDRVEGDRVILDRQAEDAKAQFGNEERDRALFERDDNREPGAHILNRSFSGTY
jgi:hypothetical protein